MKKLEKIYKEIDEIFPFPLNLVVKATTLASIMKQTGGIVPTKPFAITLEQGELIVPSQTLPDFNS